MPDPCHHRSARFCAAGGSTSLSRSWSWRIGKACRAWRTSRWPRSLEAAWLVQTSTQVSPTLTFTRPGGWGGWVPLDVRAQSPPLEPEPTLDTVRAPHPRAPVAFYARISTLIASGHALRCCPLAGVEAERFDSCKRAAARPTHERRPRRPDQVLQHPSRPGRRSQRRTPSRTRTWERSAARSSAT